MKKFGTCPVCGNEGIIAYERHYLEWEKFLRDFEGAHAIQPIVRERILRKLFNIKRDEKTNDTAD